MKMLAFNPKISNSWEKMFQNAVLITFHQHNTLTQDCTTIFHAINLHSISTMFRRWKSMIKGFHTWIARELVGALLWSSCWIVRLPGSSRNLSMSWTFDGIWTLDYLYFNFPSSDVKIAGHQMAEHTFLCNFTTHAMPGKKAIAHNKGMHSFYTIFTSLSKGI